MCMESMDATFVFGSFCFVFGKILQPVAGVQGEFIHLPADRTTPAVWIMQPHSLPNLSFLLYLCLCVFAKDRAAPTGHENLRQPCKMCINLFFCVFAKDHRIGYQLNSLQAISYSTLCNVFCIVLYLYLCLQEPRVAAESQEWEKQAR